jgi:hypothetical protein
MAIEPYKGISLLKMPEPVLKVKATLHGKEGSFVQKNTGTDGGTAVFNKNRALTRPFTCPAAMMKNCSSFLLLYHQQRST